MIINVFKNIIASSVQGGQSSQRKAHGMGGAIRRIKPRVRRDTFSQQPGQQLKRVMERSIDPLAMETEESDKKGSVVVVSKKAAVAGSSPSGMDISQLPSLYPFHQKLSSTKVHDQILTLSSATGQMSTSIATTIPLTPTNSKSSQNQSLFDFPAATNSHAFSSTPPIEHDHQQLQSITGNTTKRDSNTLTTVTLEPSTSNGPSSFTTSEVSGSNGSTHHHEHNVSL